jgi:hypothetical protein
MFTKLFQINKDYLIYFLLIFVLAPIFINLDLSHSKPFGIWRFGASTGLPSIPISMVLIAVVLILNAKHFFMNKKIQIFLFLIFVYMGLNLYFDIKRSVIVGFGMLLILVSYYVFSAIIINKKNAFKYFYLILSAILILKFISDLFIYQYYLNPRTLATLERLDTFPSTPFFLNRGIGIYNYFDYFPFVYFLSIALSFDNLLKKKYLVLSILMIMVSSVAILGTGSRLFIYATYLLPALYLFFLVTKLKLQYYYFLFLFTSFIVTISVGFINLGISDPSLLARKFYIYEYFNSFGVIDLIFPFLNELRMNTAGSFHNELLEIFSFFGFVGVYYFLILKDMFCDVTTEFKLLSFFLMFILLIGSLIQINISNPYIGIIVGLLFALMSQPKSESNSNSSCIKYFD